MWGLVTLSIHPSFAGLWGAGSYSPADVGQEVGYTLGRSPVPLSLYLYKLIYNFLLVGKTHARNWLWRLNWWLTVNKCTFYQTGILMGFKPYKMLNENYRLVTSREVVSHLQACSKWQEVKLVAAGCLGFNYLQETRGEKHVQSN